jgi:hypothetical protein
MMVRFNGSGGLAARHHSTKLHATTMAKPSATIEKRDLAVEL